MNGNSDQFALWLQEVGSIGPMGIAPPASCSSQSVRILRLPEVIARVGLKRASIYLRVADGTFPKQIALGVRAVGWLESEIDAWIAMRIQSRKNT
jgi:prophage regulatory protein